MMNHASHTLPSKVGLLASVRSPFEALIALASGADIIDAKNPHQGALGALSASEIRLIVQAIQGRCPVSATTGDWPLGSPDLLDVFASIQQTGVDYIKIGLFGVPDETALRDGLAALHLSPKESAPEGKAQSPSLIAVMMADQGVPLWPLPILKDHGFMGVMVDTANKHLGNLRTVANSETLAEFVHHAHSLGMMVGLAGSLSLEDIPALATLHPHYLGFRTALCGEEGRTSALDSSRIAQVRSALDRANSLAP
jgi:(5-formylfuran-3-yl)methyl phosphate synthase